MLISLFFLIGIMGVGLVIALKGPMLGNIGENNRFMQMLKNSRWFQHYCLSGLFLFMVNAVLFVGTGFFFYLLTFIPIPFVYFFIIMLAVAGSIFAWLLIHKAWQGTNGGRWKMAGIGSSFYGMLSLWFVYLFVCLLLLSLPIPRKIYIFRD